jgi:hypothetical protein
MLFMYLYNTLKNIVYNIVAACDQYENIVAFRKKFMQTIKDSISNEFDEDEVIPSVTTKTNFKSNTSPNLTIGKDIFKTKVRSTSYLYVTGDRDLPAYKPEWFCCSCKKKLLPYANMYCCNDNIFCTSNCRDRYLNYFRLNNNI